MRPRIVVTTSRRALGPAGASPLRQRPARPEVWLLEAYLDAIARSGGLPLPLAPVDGLAAELADWALTEADGVVISGGPVDLHPRSYGQEPRVSNLDLDPERSELELRLACGCLARGLPALGVCGGMQVLAVAAGGSLIQDIEAELPGAGEHQQPTPPSQPWHPVLLEPGRVQAVYGSRTEVNSTHHQAVAEPGALRITGRAPDGVVEAIEAPDHPWCVGVQWHPEALDAALYRALCRAAGAR
ncbi:MAG: gamma-glutamyl-gamma-aminobutyrate hydrolase family protein [Pseudomonadota bacterium]